MKSIQHIHLHICLMTVFVGDDPFLVSSLLLVGSISRYAIRLGFPQKNDLLSYCVLEEQPVCESIMETQSVYCADWDKVGLDLHSTLAPCLHGTSGSLFNKSSWCQNLRPAVVGVSFALGFATDGL